MPPLISRGFRGRGDDAPGDRVRPGQYVTRDFPVLSAGPTPRTPLDRWDFSIVGEVDEPRRWTWEEFRALPSEQVTVEIHCLTKWSKLDTVWRSRVDEHEHLPRPADKRHDCSKMLAVCAPHLVILEPSEAAPSMATRRSSLRASSCEKAAALTRAALQRRPQSALVGKPQRRAGSSGDKESWSRSSAPPRPISGWARANFHVALARWSRARISLSPVERRRRS
jgi:hypothetical protein